MIRSHGKCLELVTGDLLRGLTLPRRDQGTEQWRLVKLERTGLLKLEASASTAGGRALNTGYCASHTGTTAAPGHGVAQTTRLRDRCRHTRSDQLLPLHRTLRWLAHQHCTAW